MQRTHLIRYRPFSGEVNVGMLERGISLVAGGLVMALGARQDARSAIPLEALGGYLAYRGATGHCPLYAALQFDTAETPIPSAEVVVQRSITIGVSPQQVYDFWRDVENLPRFMKHLESVALLDERRSRWVAHGPFGTVNVWEAEVVDDLPGKMLSWKTTEDSPLHHRGSIWFNEAPGGRGTEVRAVLSYRAPGGKLGAGLALFSGEEPGQQLRTDLFRLKQILETGEVSTSERKPAGAGRATVMSGREGER